MTRVTQRRTELWHLLSAGRLNPEYVDPPLEEITKAIDLVATRSNLGRVVLRGGPFRTRCAAG